jgi:2-polyprenyl-3-methyl-5-hydroxy-6-metoxy-1,4-benzoquinol methylase
MAAPSTGTFFGKAGAVTSGELVPTEKVLCPLCDTVPEPFATDYQGFTLCRCSSCFLEFVSPRLTYEELAQKVYADNYFPKRRSTERRSAEAEDYYGKQLSQFEARIDGRKVLDIGCGNGSFLEFARERGWDISGVDIMLSPDARELGCRLWEGKLQEIDFGSGRFDLIRLNHVLEHTQEPVRELEICRELLNPGGLLFISVPNIAGLSPRLKSIQSRLGLKSHRWRHYAAMHHLFFFSPETLRKVVEKAGFKVLDWNTPVPKKSGQNALVEGFYRSLMERTGTASILDLYCTPGSVSARPANAR